MKKIFKRKSRQEKAAEIANAIDNVARYVIQEIRAHPFVVKHDIKRNIPRPIMATLIAENGGGEQYRQSLNLSYRNSFPVTFPVQFFTGRNEDIGITPIRIMIHLEYDPQDR